MEKMISISLMQEKPCAAVFQYKDPVLIPGVSDLPDRFASAKADSAAFLGEPAARAIVIIPSFYNLRQRDALIKEARKANLKLVRFLSPPASAALLDYRRKREFYDQGEEKTVLICTLIGDIFDAAIALMGNEVVEILATAGVSSRDPEAIESTLQKLLAEPEVPVSTFHRVLMIGEAYYVPEIQSALHPFVTTDTLVGVYGAEDAVLGGAVQSGILEGVCEYALLLNAIPHSLGIGVEGGAYVPLVTRNTAFPITRRETFTNAQDHQTDYEICLYEGEAPKAALNQRITCFHITGLDPCPKGTAEIDIVLDMDANGILKVDARDMRSGKVLKPVRGNPGTYGLLAKPTKKTEETVPVSPSQAVVPTEATEWILRFLPVYDDLMLALEQPTKDEAFKKGVRLTMKKLIAIFTELGAEFYGHRGESFDPMLHNAVMHIESPQYGENTITKVLQKGVKLHGKILRFAMVEVAN